VCSVAITFIVTPILVNRLGDEQYGIWSIAISLASYYALSNLGLRAAGVKYVSQFDAVQDRESVNAVVMTMFSVYLAIAASVILIAIVVAFAFPSFLKAESVPSNSIRLVVLLTGLAVSVGMLGQNYETILVALKRFDQIVVLSVLSKLIQSAMIILAIAKGGGLVAMAIIVLGVMVVRQLITGLLAVRAAPYLSISLRYVQIAMLKRLFGFGLSNVVLAVARRINNFGGTLIVGMMLGPATATYYKIAESLAVNIEDLGKGVSSVLMPVASQLDAQGRRKDVTGAFLLSSRTVLALMASVSAMFVTLGKPLIATWISQAHADGAYSVLCLLGIGMAVHTYGLCASSILKGTGNMTPLVRAALVDVLLTCVLSLVLTYRFGIVGMGLAILIVQILIGGIVVPTITCRVIGVTTTAFLQEVGVLGLSAAMPATALSAALSYLSPPTMVLHVVAHAALIMLVTAASIFLVCFDRAIRVKVLYSVFPWLCRVRQDS